MKKQDIQDWTAIVVGGVAIFLFVRHMTIEIPKRMKRRREAFEEREEKWRIEDAIREEERKRIWEEQFGNDKPFPGI